MKHFIRTMAPGWFASVMGTAVTSLAFTLLAEAFPQYLLPSLAADLFHFAAIVLLVLLGIPAVLRVLIFPGEVRHTISHPVEGSFYATFPIAMLVMAGQWGVRGIAPELVALLWWLGTILIFIISYMVLFALFSTEKLKLEMVTPAHFIPAVGLVVIPVAGASIASAAMGVMREVYFGINMLAFGAGIFMYVGLLALTMARHFTAAPIEGKMTPTLWVHMAPLGVIPLSLLSLLHAAGDASALKYGMLVAAGFLGAALWWLFLCLALTAKNIVTGKLPFALSWWAFLFPVGAMTVLALRLARLFELSLLPYVGVVLSLLLCVIWVVAATGTVRGLLKGTLLPPRQI